jgi:glycosyltransferase 2 family protein
VPPADTQPMREVSAGHPSVSKSLFTILRFAVGIGLLVYLAKSGIVNFGALSRLFSAWPLTVAALTLLFFDIFLMSVRQSWLFRPHGLVLPLWKSFQLTLTGFFFSNFLPGAAGGDLTKLFYAARKNSGRRTEIVTIVLLDRAIGLFSLLLLPLLFAPFFPNLIRSVAALRILLFGAGVMAIALLSAFVACLFNESIRRPWRDCLLRCVPRKSHVERILAAVASYRRNPGVLFSALGASLLANLSVVVVTAFGVLITNPGGMAARIYLVIPIGHILNSLPLTPGGLGVGETAFNGLFHMAGLRGGAEALLCWRVWNILVGLLGLAFYLRGLNRVVFAAETPDEDADTAAPRAVPAGAGPLGMPAAENDGLVNGMIKDEL